MTETNELLRADLRRDTELVADNIEITKFPQLVHVTVDNMRRLIADSDRLERIERQLVDVARYLEGHHDFAGVGKDQEVMDTAARRLRAIVDTGDALSTHTAGESPSAGHYGTDLDEFEHKNGV